MIHQGEALTVLATLPAESVQCCVTSPPYWGLRDYGTASWSGGVAGCDHMAPDEAGGTEKPTSGQRAHAGRFSGPTCWRCGAQRTDSQLGLEPTPEEYVANMVEVFREVRRVLRSDGTLWLNLGDSYAANRGNGASSVGPKQATNVGANLGRLIVPPGLKPKDLVGIPWMLAFALRADGWYLRSDIIWSKPNPMPESVTDRPTKAHEYLFLLSKSERYFYDADAIRTPLAAKTYTTFGTVRQDPGDGSGLIKSENYGASVPVRKPRLKRDADQQVSGGDRMTGFNARWDKREGVAGDGHGRLIDHVAEARLNGQDHDTALTPLAGANARTVWTIATTPYPEAHFATFPEALVEPCVKAGTRIGDVVLDPFAGSGTTLAVAKRLGREGIGIELNPDYIRLAEKRIGHVIYQPGLFGLREVVA